MAPYTLASYSNSVRAAESAADAAGSAQAAAASASALDAFQSSAQNMLSSYVDQATTRATAAANTATSMRNYAKTYMNSALDAANSAQTTLVTIQDEYAKVETFTNWFYQTANSGKIITNMHYHVHHWDVTDDRRNIDGTISITDTRSGITATVPYKVKESGASGVQWPNSSFTFLTTYSGYATAGNGDTLQVVYTNDAPGSASDVYVHGDNYLLHQASFTLLLKKNTDGDPIGWRVYRATSIYHNSDILSNWYDYDLSWANPSHIDQADGVSASGNPTYARAPYGLVRDMANVRAVIPPLAAFATNTYDAVTNLAPYAATTRDMATNLALYATNTYAAVTNLAPYATNTHDTVTNLALYATNTYSAVTNLENMVTNRVDAQIAWDTGSRVVLYITKFLSGDSQKKTMYAASYDSVLSASSAMLTFDSAHDVETGQTGSSDPKVCRISAVGWYGSGSSYAKLGIRLDYDTGTTATNWINTGTAASTLFRASGYVKTLSNQYMYTSPSASGSSSRTISGTLRVLPKGTY